MYVYIYIDGIKAKLSATDHSTVEKALEAGLEWLQAASSDDVATPTLRPRSKEEFDSKKKEIEMVIAPIVEKVYTTQPSSSAPPSREKEQH